MKGIFTQAVVLLTDGRSTIDSVRESLAKKGFDAVRQMPANEDWRLGGPSVLIPFRPEVNGYAIVDVVSRPWPDTMGDPKSDPLTFGAWTLGHLGPWTYPGGLERAGQHSWEWAPGKTIARSHRGFIRIRLSYCLGAGEEAVLRPADDDSVRELDFLGRMVLALFPVSGVLCYFNPNGEVLRDEPSFAATWELARRQENPPVPLWINVRLYNLTDRLCLMDTVGHGQLDRPDVEAIFPKVNYSVNRVAGYLRNVSLYLLGLDREIRTGETIDGPGETNLSWTIEVMKDGLLSPPRGVLRLCPKTDRQQIQDALAGLKR
jgi:hypothetical protein